MERATQEGCPALDRVSLGRDCVRERLQSGLLLLWGHLDIRPLASDWGGQGIQIFNSHPLVISECDLAVRILEGPAPGVFWAVHEAQRPSPLDDRRLHRQMILSQSRVLDKVHDRFLILPRAPGLIHASLAIFDRPAVRFGDALRGQHQEIVPPPRTRVGCLVVLDSESHRLLPLLHPLDSLIW